MLIPAGDNSIFQRKRAPNPQSHTEDAEASVDDALACVSFSEFWRYLPLLEWCNLHGVKTLSFHLSEGE